MRRAPETPTSRPNDGPPRLAPARAAWWVAAGLTLGAGGLYAFTAAPDLALVDSAELALACATGGVPHPPGVPLYRLLGGIFTALPGASPVRMMNLMSALFAAFAVGAVFLAAERMLAFRATTAGDRLPGRSGESPAGRGGPRLVAASAAALAFATSWNPWTWSAMAEVYTLNVLLIAAAWACGWAAVVPGAPTAPAIAALFVASFGLANHHATALLAFPVLVLMAAVARPALLRSRTLLGVAAVAMATALSLYLTLIPAARHDPGLGWGGTTTLALLARHVAGTQYSLQVGATLAESLRVAREFGSTLFFGCGVPTALLAAGGLVAGFARRRAPRAARLVVLAPVAMIALNLLLSARYIAGPEDRMAYDLPATIAWCLLAALGADALLATTRYPRTAAAAVVITLPVAWNVVRNLPLCNLRHERCARLFAEEMLGDAPPRSVVFTSEWNLVAPYLWMRHVEDWRTDLRVIDVLMMRRFWYLDYVERSAPGLVAASRPEFDAYRDQIRRFDLGQPYDQVNIQSLYDALMTRWVEIGREEGGAFVDWSTPAQPQEASWIGRLRTVPDGMWLRFASPADPIAPGVPGPCDVRNLRDLRSRITPASLDGDRSTLVPRFDPYWKVWSQYQAAVTASLLVAAREGREPFEARRRELAAWFPETDRAADRALRMR